MLSLGKIQKKIEGMNFNQTVKGLSAWCQPKKMQLDVLEGLGDQLQRYRHTINIGKIIILGFNFTILKSFTVFKLQNFINQDWVLKQLNIEFLLSFSCSKECLKNADYFHYDRK